MKPFARAGAAADSLGMAAVLLLMCVFFGASTEHFFSATTARTILNQIPDAVLLAVGMTWVLVIGGIDLSVGSVLALSSALLGVALAQWQLPFPAAAALAVACGLACGAANGWLVTRWRIPSFIVTLGMLEIARGGAYLLTNSQTKYIGDRIDFLADMKYLGLSIPFACAILVVAAAQFVLSRGIFGRHALAVGQSEQAARFSGIDSARVKLIVFSASGALAGLASIAHTARLASADPNSGAGMELQAIAAVVIGGTSLMGGRGSIVNSFLGVLVIATLGAGLIQIGASEPAKRVVTGCVIILAVIVDQLRSRRARRAAAA